MAAISANTTKSTNISTRSQCVDPRQFANRCWWTSNFEMKDGRHCQGIPEGLHPAFQSGLDYVASSADESFPESFGHWRAFAQRKSVQRISMSEEEQWHIETRQLW